MPAFIQVPYSDMILRLTVALILGGTLGVERQWKQRTAGLRTNVLVAVGAASFVLFALSFQTHDDVSKIAGYVISGIGFLGAGVIMRDGGNVKGINTAATLWCSTAIGMFAGLGLLYPATIVTVFIVVSNVLLSPLVRYINSHPMNDGSEAEMFYGVSIICRRKEELKIRELVLESLVSAGFHLRKIASTKIDNSDKVDVYASFMALGNQSDKMEEIVGKLSLNASVKSINWTNKTDN